MKTNLTYTYTDMCINTLTYLLDIYYQQTKTVEELYTSIF